MKTKFYNSIGYNTACITLESNGSIIPLHYHLNDNPVQYAWQAMFKDCNKFKMGISMKLSSTEIIESINRLIQPMGLPLLSNPTPQSELNWLHTKFVENPDSSSWQRINLYIHLLEDKIKERELQGTSASQRFYLDPEPTYIPLKEEHKLWLTTEKRWGDLLLGYATLGKGWWEICQDNDSADDLALQTAIGSETIMVLQPETMLFKDVKNRFYKWAKTTAIDVPIVNLNQLSLGRYYLGNIIITKELLKYHPTASDWYVPNHKCKLMWSKEIIGADTVVKSVDFFDSDMYYNTLLEHTDIQLTE